MRISLWFTVAKRHSVVEGTGLRYMTLRCSRTSLAGHGGGVQAICVAQAGKNRAVRGAKRPARFFVAVATQITRNHSCLQSAYNLLVPGSTPDEEEAEENGPVLPNFSDDTM